MSVCYVSSREGSLEEQEKLAFLVQRVRESLERGFGYLEANMASIRDLVELDCWKIFFFQANPFW